MIAELTPLLSGLAAKAASEVFAAGKLSEDDAVHLREGQSPQQFVEAAMAAEAFATAVRFLAAASPKRTVIQWGLRVARHAGQPSPGERAAVTAVEAWLADPSDQNRRACFAVTQKHGLQKPALLVALSVFLSEGSMAPPTVQQPVPAEPHLTGQLIGNAIVLAGVIDRPDQAAEKYQTFLHLAAA